MNKPVCISLLIAVFAAFAADARISLPAVISDNMVLQQQDDVRLWGEAAPGENVRVMASWADAPVAVKAGADGHWECTVSTPEASFDRHQIVFKGKNTVTVDNVLIGEVWMCTGQSNMVFPVGPHPERRKWQTGMVDMEAQLKDADYPGIRFFKVEYCESPGVPKDDCGGSWIECTPESAFDFSAVGFVFGRRLFNELDVPVGLISASRGDTHAESWIKEDVMKDNPFYDDVYAEFGIDKVEQSRKPYKVPATLWNGMINPVLRYRVRGNIWYQGEANDMRADRYQQVFTDLIDSWREELRNPDMPFYFVQIAPYYKQSPAIREAQLDTWQSGIRNIGMAVITDGGDSLDIHPRDKALPGERLARWALAKDYGKDVAYSGPLYRSMKPVGSAVELSFDYAGSGLAAQGGGELVGFMVAGPDRRFVRADARIEGDKVVVSSPEVRHPVAVRYGFDCFFRANLCNNDGLPASPFRTDRWPVKKQ